MRHEIEYVQDVSSILWHIAYDDLADRWEPLCGAPSFSKAITEHQARSGMMICGDCVQMRYRMEAEIKALIDIAKEGV